MLPTAAAFEQPEHVGVRATAWFEALGAKVRVLAVLRRADAEDAEARRDRAQGAVRARGRRFAAAPALGAQGLRAVRGACSRPGRVVPCSSASGAGATLLCDPMVDPRGGAYTVGLGRGAQPRGVPVPRHRGRPPPRALDRPAARRARRWSASTRTPRSCSRAAPGAWPARARSPSTPWRRARHLRGRRLPERSPRLTPVSLRTPPLRRRP